MLLLALFKFLLAMMPDFCEAFSSYPFYRPKQNRILSARIKGLSRTNNEQRMISLNASNGNSNIDIDPVLQLPLMEAELDKLANTQSKNPSDEQDNDIGELNRTSQDELKEKIDNAKTAAEFGVRRAQVDFYDAFSNQDLEKMKQIWSDDDSIVRCIHPGMPSINGKEMIMRSWMQVFQGDAFVIEPSRVKIEICGKTAMCSCIENTPGGGKLEALNVYRRQEGRWHMTLHMASPIMVPL